jgi:hypothetical protein
MGINYVNSVHFTIREAQSAVNDHYVVLILVYGEFFTDLIKPSKGYNF